jgi:hypothetical protein
MIEDGSFEDLDWEAPSSAMLSVPRMFGPALEGPHFPRACTDGVCRCRVAARIRAMPQPDLPPIRFDVKPDWSDPWDSYREWRRQRDAGLL